jgi:hypothetical protein
MPMMMMMMILWRAFSNNQSPLSHPSDDRATERAQSRGSEPHWACCEGRGGRENCGRKDSSRREAREQAISAILRSEASDISHAPWPRFGLGSTQTTMFSPAQSKCDASLGPGHHALSPVIPPRPLPLCRLRVKSPTSEMRQLKSGRQAPQRRGIFDE